MLKKMFLFCFLLLNLNAEVNATDTNLSFDSPKIETEAPSIQKIKELKNLNELDQTKDFAGVLSLEIQDELEKSEYKNDHIKERIELRLQNTISKQITARQSLRLV